MEAAIDVGIFDIIAQAGGGGLSSANIAARLAVRDPNLRQMLEPLVSLLSCHDVLTCSEGCYSLTPAAKYFARNEDRASLAPLMRLNHDRVFLESWSAVKDAILQGGNPFNRAHRTSNVFEYLGKDGSFSQVYNTAMVNHTAIVVKQILQSYQGFDDVKTLVDVVGGIRVALNLITAMHPSIKGINFDLPDVIQNAPPVPGLKHVAGDMFESIPEGDAIFMKSIPRDWGDDQCVKLLKNCYNALPKHGKVIVVEQHLPIFDDLASSMKEKLSNDVLAMTLNPGGKERNYVEFTKLGAKAGFSEVIIPCVRCQYLVIEYIK